MPRQSSSLERPNIALVSLRPEVTHKSHLTPRRARSAPPTSPSPLFNFPHYCPLNTIAIDHDDAFCPACFVICTWPLVLAQVGQSRHYIGADSSITSNVSSHVNGQGRNIWSSDARSSRRF